MKCPYCGAETPSGDRCQYCNSELPKPNQTINIVNNYYNNANPGNRSANAPNNNYSQQPNPQFNNNQQYNNRQQPSHKKDNTWLWVLGWICCFPIPLTIVLLRKKNMKPALKYGIIAFVWIVCIIFAIGSESSKETTNTTNTNSNNATNETATASTTAEDTIDIVAGEAGEYGKTLVLNENTDLPYETIGYFVPAGTYEITNIGDYQTQANVYKNEKHVTDEGWEEWTDGTSEIVGINETIEMTIPDGYFFKCDEPSHFTLKKID